MKTLKLLIVTIVCVVLASVSLSAEENLLKNGDFAIESTKTGGPSKWWIGTKTRQQIISVDKQEAPEGCTQSLRLEIKSVWKNQAEIGQSLKDLEKNKTYVLQGKIKSTMKGLGLFQIKLYKGIREKDGKPKELKRITTAKSDTQWKTVTKEFSTEDADKVTILCRCLQSVKAIGETVWFADVKLTEKGAE